MKEEYVYLVDEKNNILGRVTRSEMRKKNLRHRGVRFFIMNQKGEILITKRTPTKDVYPGLLETNQAGTVCYGDSYEETAKREIEEEIGIKNPKIELLFESYYEDERNKSFAKVYKCVYDGEIKPQKEEIDDCFFISLDKLKRMVKMNPDKFTPDSIYSFKKYIELLGS